MSSQPFQEAENIPDIDEQVRRYRLGDIDDARNRLRDAREKVRRWLIVGNGTYEQASQLYLIQLKSFLLEVLPYAEKSAKARAFWVPPEIEDGGAEGIEERIGEVTIDPPPRGADVWSRSTGDIPNQTYEDLGPVVVDEWRGLLDVLHAPESYEASFAYKGKKNAMPRRYAATVTGYPGFDHLDDATRWGYRFSQYVGLDMGLGDDLEDAELPYEDLFR